MFLQYLSLTKKLAEEKLVGCGVLHKNKLIINLIIYLNRSPKNILNTSWSVRGENSLAQNKVFLELYLKYSKIRNQRLNGFCDRLAFLCKISSEKKNINCNVYKRNCPKFSSVVWNTAKGEN